MQSRAAPFRALAGGRRPVSRAFLWLGIAGLSLASAAHAAPALNLAPTPIVLPTLTAGPPVPAPQSGPTSGPANAVSALNGRIVRVQGIAGIQAATILPQGARDFLVLHARGLPAGEIANYVVNLDLAEDWFRRHPEPDSVHAAATASHDSHTGCNSPSLKCAGEVVKHAEDEVQRQAKAEWDHVTGEAAHDWNMVESCFSETQLDLHGVPVDFSIAPGFSTTASRSPGNRSVGVAETTLGVDLPVDARFSASLELSYIPCLPFAVRPKSIAADGSLDIGERLTAGIDASGDFAQTFTIPPGGGADFAVQRIPVDLNGTTIAMLDISVYLDGQVTVEGSAKMSGQIQEEFRQHAEFGFACGGGGCNLSVRAAPQPLTTTEAAEMDGRVSIQPAILGELGISFAGGLLSARAGAEPYLKGEIAGCSSAAASQSTNGSSTANQNSGLTADYDWGIQLVAEARSGSVTTGSTPWKQKQRHIAFQDLAHSTNLRAVIKATQQAAAQSAAAFQVSMPSCYPYSDPIDYQLAWTGNPSAAQGAPASSVKSGASSAPAAPGKSGVGPTFDCSLNPSSGRCTGDPRHEVFVNLTWPSAGTYVVRAAAMRDSHGRVFQGVPATEQSVEVQGPQQQAAAAPVQSAPTPAPALPHIARAPAPWSLQPNLKLKGAGGALVIGMPPGAGNTPIRVRPAGQQTTALTGLGKQNRRLPPGTYDVMIGNVLIPGVEIRGGNDTQIKVGALRVNADQRTTYEIFDASNQQVAKKYGQSITGLPAGNYLLRIDGKVETVTIEDGQIVDY